MDDSNSVATIEEPHVLAQQPAQTEAATILAVIQRAASDPNTDVEKMDRLLQMHERFTAAQAKTDFDAALAEMQPNLPTIERNGAIIIRDKNNPDIIKQSTPYALWEDINEAIRPALAEHGFALSFKTGVHEDGRIKVTTILSHKSGHREQTEMILPHDSTGSKNNVQAIGSSTSYGKRYGACAILNITSRGEDDDGQAACGPATITDEQLAEIKQLIVATGSDIEKFCRFMRVDTLPDIPASAFKRAKKALEDKAKADA